ncbi:MAG: ribonuclease Z [Clostridia bacterium]|nr:ribonuclease Z [Clostridia bacterium]
MIDLCTLGTGGALPLPDRGLASLYVRVNGRGLLIDCGEGTQTAIRLIGWGFRAIDAMLITHFHADHCGGVPGFLLSLAKAKRTEPFHIYGPAGLKAVIDGLRVVAPQLPYEVVLHEIPDGGMRFTEIGLTVDAFPLHHSVPCLGYCFRLERPPAFDPVKARALGIPQHLWGRLQQGETAAFDGRTFTPDQVQGAPRKGLHFVYATDTRPVDAIVRMGEGADLLLLEGMYGGEDKRPQALKNRHMIFHEAAELARRAGAKQLVLTHFSNCIDDPAEYLPQAQAIFPETVAAANLMTLTLRYPTR